MPVKLRKILVCLLVMAAVVLTTALPASAIGFVAEEKYEAVFVIRSGNSLGSGFSLGENCVVTNAHVIGDINNVTVSCYDGTQYEAYVLGKDDAKDIAVLLIEGVKLPVLEVATEENIKTGGDVWAIGTPKSLDYTLTKGVISAKERQMSGDTYVQHDAPINEGNSGGPLLNDGGQVVGMNTMKLTEAEGIGLAIPISRICRYVESLGATLDEKGNVVGTLEKPAPVPEETYPDADAPQEPQVIIDTRYAKRAAVATMVAVVSVLMNIVFGIALLLQKKKKHIPAPAPMSADPRERTDFDIEILE